MDEEQRKEIELLLENSDKDKDSAIKKYARLVLPHVALVAVVCIYAMIGAYVFYSLESPHEDRLKSDGIRSVQRHRRELVELLWRRREVPTKEEWVRRMSQSLQKFNTNLYKAYKDQYVRYGDVRLTKPDPLTDPRTKRHRSSSKSRSESGGKLWTATSSIFFAATTMATIGYGNVVPVTMHGRMACVVFALFGAPLAIITIGDLGKFLSECTIWLYKKMIDTRRLFGLWLNRMRNRRKGIITEVDVEGMGGRNSGEKSNIDWDEFDRTEVPVLLVFIILLVNFFTFSLYSFSFILLLVGFCSLLLNPGVIWMRSIIVLYLVPERHEYIVLMLVYLGVGLAVTTMCIDLVGIKYIQKIHYFGRKFRGTDILQLLKRKRMLERQLVMGNTDEIINYIQHVAHEQQKETPQPPKLNLKTANEQWQTEMEAQSMESAKEESWHANEQIVDAVPLEQSANILESEGAAMDATTTITHEEPIVADSISLDNRQHRAEYIPRPPSPLSNSSAGSRDLMYSKWDKESGKGSAESGPALSNRSSVHTTPSVEARERMFGEYGSPNPSILSFEETDGPWPNLKEIAAEARQARRINSCPGEVERPSSPTPYSALQEQECFLSQSCSSLTSHPEGITCVEEWVSYMQMLDDVQQPLSRVRSPIYTHIDELRPATELPQQPFHCPKWALPNALPTQIETPRLHSPPQTLPNALPEAVEPILQSDPLLSPRALRIDTERPEPLSLDVTVEQFGDVISPVFPDTSSDSSFANSPLFDIDLGAFELVDSGLSAEALLSQEDPMIFHRDMPVHSVHHDTVQTEAALENLMNAPESMLSTTVPPAMVADNYCFIVDGDKIKMGDIMSDDQWWRHTSRPTKYFFSEDMKKFFRVNCITAKGKIISAKLASTMPMSGGPTLGVGGTPSTDQPGPSGLSSSLPTTAVASMATTPRSSMSVAGKQQQRGEKVPLEHVYKVIRFYSFWKTCTSFHRIVTMIDRVIPADPTENFPTEFKRRLFVQYLWRNAKASEKARVQREFDPRRQRLLRFVTNPADRSKRGASTGPSWRK